MTRLTNELRQEICNAAIAAAFDDKLAVMKRQEAALAKDAYESVFSEAERALVAAVPCNWFRKDPCLNFNVDGLRIRLETGDEGYPVPYEIRGRSGYRCHDELGVIHGDLAAKITAHAVALDALTQERKKAKRELSALLVGMTSIARLREAWPEGEPFYGVYASKPAAQLPAIRFAEINAALGITPVQS